MVREISSCVGGASVGGESTPCSRASQAAQSCRVSSAAEASRTASEDELKAAAVAVPNVARYVEGKTPKKVIVVKGRMVNIVL